MTQQSLFNWKAGLGATTFLLVALKISQWVLPRHWGIFAPILLLYIPFFIYWRKRQPIDFLDRTAESFFRNLGLFLVTVLLIFPPYLLMAHYWMIHIFD